MNNAIGLISNLGGLHDAWVQSLSWEPERARIDLLVRDLYVDRLEDDDYPGPQPGFIRMTGITKVDIDIESDSGIRIYDFDVKGHESGLYVARLDLSPGGKLMVVFREIEIEFVPT